MPDTLASEIRSLADGIGDGGQLAVRSSATAEDLAFPSGHVIHAVVVFGLVPLVLWTLTNSRVFLRIGFGLFFFVVALVAFSRVRLGAHWPSDDVSSFFIGGSLLHWRLASSLAARFFIGGSLLLAAEQILTSTWTSDRCSLLGYHPSDLSPER